jgi:mono/diheme cytochrome c family protein
VTSYREPTLTGLAVVALVGAVAAAFAGGQQGGRAKWVAPESARSLVNPIPSSPEVLAEGRRLFEKNCLTCHGARGKGDGPASQFVKPTPADISSPEVRNRMMDGELFWKITEGRKPMPPFEKKLVEDERWKLVHYIRSLGTTEAR